MTSKMLEQRKIEAEIRQAAAEGRTELDFRFRRFLELPKSLLEVTGLKKLELFETHLEIPDWLSQIHSLEELDIGEAKSVRSLLPVIHELRNLRVLKMGYAGLEEPLPDTFGQLENLEELTLSGADFSTFPQCIGKLKKLRSLSFKYCECAPDEVFEILSRLPNLKELRITFDQNYALLDNEEDCIQNVGFDMPPSLLKLSQLEVLDLHDFSELRSLPDNIHELSNLKKLDLSQDMDYGCELCKLPDSLFEISSFEYLNIINCQNITQFPNSIKRWQTPKFLNSSASGVKFFPAFSKDQLENLEELSWGGSLPDLSHATHLKRLAVYNGLVSVWFNQQVTGTECSHKYEFPLLPELEELIISGGILAETDFLLNFPKLKRLYLYCDFQELTENIGNLQNLEEIRIFGAKEMKGLPISFSQLNSLKSLSISASSLSEVPHDMSSMESLVQVNLDHVTGMTELAEGWYTLPALEMLKIERCADMKKIPDGISQLVSLEKMRLHGNEKLLEMPSDFGGLKNLHSLSWDGGKVPFPCFAGLDSLEFLRISRVSPDSLPDSLFCLPKLRHFTHVNSNAIRLPERYATFPNLKSLELICWDHLSSIPERLVQDSSLEELIFHQCDFADIPKGLENPYGVKSINFSLCDKIKDALQNVSGVLAEKLNKYN